MITLARPAPPTGSLAGHPGTVLACDLGSSGLRMALVDARGVVRALHRSSGTHLVRSGHGSHDVDPAEWWAALINGATILGRDAPAAFEMVAAIAISGMTRTQVFVDSAIKPICRAHLWSDTRSQATLADLQHRLPPTHPETPQVNAFHALARLWWLRITHPETYERSAWVLEPKDYLNAMLTGICASDAVSMARLAAAAEPCNGSSLLDAAGIDPKIIPCLGKPISIMGRVRADLPGALARLANVPVVTMAHDTFASVAGLGALRPGFAYNLSGTTEVLGLVSAQGGLAEGLLSVDWSEGMTQLGGPSLAGGDTLRWLLEVVGARFDGALAVDTALQDLWAMPKSSQPLLFLPYLSGERVPYWDPSLRGAWIGLSREHGPADLARSVFEGVAFLNRIVLERAEAAMGARIAEIRFGGGGAASPHWCQIKADVIGRRVVTTDSDDHGLIGAALIAWTALGVQPSLDIAQEALVGVDRTFEPNPGRHAAYTVLFELYRTAEQAVAPISHHLSALQHPAV